MIALYDAQNWAVTRRHELTPPRSIISMFYRADRRRDPTPDDSGFARFSPR